MLSRMIIGASMHLPARVCARTLVRMPAVAAFRSRGMLLATRSISSARGSPRAFGAANTTGLGERVDVDSTMSEVPLDTFSISPVTALCLRKTGITGLFPVQAKTLELVMEGRDLICRSPTGTGKTLGFALPVVEKLLEQKQPAGSRSAPRALVLAPTRELAKQIAETFETIAPQLQTVCVYGGAPSGLQRQQLRRGSDVVVGTPGRVIDFLQSGDLNFSRVAYAVLDEADEMLRTGFQEAVDEIMRSVPTTRQTMLWSATVPDWVRDLASTYMNNPAFIDLVGEHQRMRLPAGAVNVAVPAPRDDRHRVHLLGSLIRTHTQDSRCLVFTRTKRDAAALAEMEGLADISMALHGDMSQALRERALDAFRQGTVRCLVATDVAARGLDIPAVEAVIHYSLPSNTESFVHRSGRTARAGRSGHNIVLFTPSEHVMLAQLEREVGFQFQIRAAPKLQEVLQRSMLTAVENAAGVSAAVIEQCRAAAEQLSGRLGANALPAALALLAGANSSAATATFSLLNGSPGQQTVRVMGGEGSGPVTQDVCRTLVRTLSPNAFFTSNRQAVDGSVLLDLLPEQAAQLVELSRTGALPHGLRAEVPEVLPELQGGYTGAPSFRGSARAGGFRGFDDRGGRGGRGGHGGHGGRGGRGGHGGHSGRGGDAGFLGGNKFGERSHRRGMEAGDDERGSGHRHHRHHRHHHRHDENAEGGSFRHGDRGDRERGGLGRFGGGASVSGGSKAWDWQDPAAGEGRMSWNIGSLATGAAAGGQRVRSKARGPAEEEEA